MVHQRLVTGRARAGSESFSITLSSPAAYRAPEQLVQQDLVGLGTLGALDVLLGLQHRHQPGGEHLPADVELLLDDRGDALAVGEIDHRALLGAEHAELLRAV
jgi:hypothetical protein